MEQEEPSLGGWKDQGGIIALSQEGHCWRTRSNIITGPGGTRRTWRDHQGQSFRTRRGAVV